MEIFILIFAIVLIINVTCSFSIIFIERKEPSTTWAWLLVLLILPGIGFIFYLLFGQNFSRERLFKEKKKLDKEKRKEVLGQIEKEYKDLDENNNFVDLIKMNYNNSGSKLMLNNEIDLYFDGKDKFKQLIYDLEHAEKYIHIQYYIIRKDKLGRKIISILEKKVKEGVQVRFLVDSMGGYTLTKRFLKNFINNGGKFEIFFPGILPHVNTRINYRNHRKIVIIDGKYGYTGGFNVGDEYISEDKKIGYWRDTHIRIRGDAVNPLNDRFLMDWCYASGEEIEHFSDFYLQEPYTLGDKAIQIVTSGPDHNEEYIKNALFKLINNTKEKIYIETPYFVLDESMLESIKISAMSGVDVRIVIPKKPDHIFMKWIAYSYLEELLEAGVKVYAYNKGFIHAKTMVSDGYVSTVGTANMDIRSFSLNFEVNAFIYNKEVADKLERQFMIDIEDSDQITLNTFKKRSRRERVMESIMRLFAPIL
ncbi:MAG: cardiolipin synthase [Clostridium sp.]|nr:cardiolipin synthase [Clostridium sp.]